MNIKNCCTRYTTVESLRGRLAVERALGKKIGFLATMGALHEGHLTLARDLREHADIVVASVFVNPTQFNDKKDYEAYLINIDADHAALEEQGVEILFAPAVDEIYPSGFQTTLKPGALTQRWEGEFRPGHFAGMATVVAILLSIVSPDVSIFGEKDFQQLRIVEQMVKDLRFPVKILRGRLVREESGLAMSSRNVRLTPENRSAAAAISRGLLSAKSLAANGVVEVSELLAAARSQILQIPEHEIEYLTAVDEDTLEPISVVTSAARLLTVVRVQGVRLLDNIAL